MGSKRSRRSKKKLSARRKPKFRSLKNHLDVVAPHPAEPISMDDNDSQVACLLEEGNEPDAGATITHLFGSSSTSSSVVVDEVVSPASPSVEWDGDGLARRALRGRERWVFCRSSEEVVEQQRLQLKLDYDEVLTAWSDRGPLYIDGEGPQVVPELHHGSITPSVFVTVGDAGVWRVPEMEVEGKEHKIINREERVMRYKAKRQSRLFSKRIRYEVRKLNAEKRPRIKGRFVKRVEDM